MLKYLFIAKFEDETSLCQNHDDVSSVDNKRSAFYDVMQKIESGVKLIAFQLTDTVNVFEVNLLNGKFSINGFEIACPVVGNDQVDVEMKNYRVIYFRKHRKHFNQQFEEQLHETWYRFGWQANDETGKNHKRIFEIS